MDAEHVRDLTAPIRAPRARHALGASLAQAGDEFAAQLPLGLGVDGVVDGLVGHMAAGVGREGSLERNGDFLGRPLPGQHRPHRAPQHAVRAELASRAGGLASPHARPARTSRHTPWPRPRCARVPATRSMARGPACATCPAG